MKRFIIAVFIFLFSLTGISISSTASFVNVPAQNAEGSVNASGLQRTSYFYEEEYIYVRVLIDGRWWTYVYALDGSFIVAIPDEDE
jgi:hypothetical protein